MSEKAKYGGFWQPSGGGKGHKGKGKNKSKGKPSFPKRSLEQRIANSQCKRCFQWGHWKAECPQRHQGSTGSTSAAGAAFTGVAQNVDDDLPPENAVAFVAQSSQDFRVGSYRSLGRSIGQSENVNLISQDHLVSRRICFVQR